VIAGVCGGLAEYLGVDPVIIRVAAVMLAVFGGGSGLLLYAIAWIVMPEETTGSIERTAAQRPSASGPGLPLGVLLIVGGALWLVNTVDFVEVDLGVALAVALIAVGAVLIATLGNAATGGLIVLGTLATIVLASASVVDIERETAFGDRVERPAVFAEMQPSYSHMLGSMTLDFTRLTLPVGTTTTKAVSLFGSLQVFVPSDAGVRIVADNSFGRIEAFGQQVDGVQQNRVLLSPNYQTAERRLEIEISSSFGSVEVIRR
jgi:phage shock protein PspC (stress-responsive transcriptional regulator)/predicted membrane protein